MSCCRCGCNDPRGDAAHALVAAVAVDDLDAAMALGLIDGHDGPSSSPACRTALAAVREDRRRALAARDRFRAREARLARRQRERSDRRATGPVPAGAGIASPPTLPPAAAAALARAKARAADGRDR
jgi:hypothetical protein